MTDTPTLGLYLRLERERRGLALRSISESTKLSVALLEGLESDDISRWPGGIFRRAFVRSYAQCVGLDPDEIVRRFEAQFPPDEAMAVAVAAAAQAVPLVHAPTATLRQFPPAAVEAARFSQRARIRGTAADLGVALVLAFGFAAAGSRLLWPVLLIACYYAAGVLLTGTSPMVALLSDPGLPAGAPEAAEVPEPKPTRKARRERAGRRESARRGAERGVATTQDAQVRI